MFLYKKCTGKTQGLPRVKCFQATQQYGEGSEGPGSTGDAENTETKQTAQSVIGAINNDHHDCCQNSAVIQTWVMI